MAGGVIKRWVCSVVLLVFMLTSVVPSTYAQSVLLLPPTGQMVALSPAFNPPVLKGIKVYPDNPLRFDFILDKGDDKSTDAQIKTDSTRLIKYFLASLTIPEKDLWVNLSPYEKDRIVPEAFGQTEMGRDLLAQDYLLKQITSSLLYPEGDTGKKFWQKVYVLAQEKYGTTDIPVDTFNKVWIVPEKAVVYENGKVGAAYVTESRLKVMLETDYLATSNNVLPTGGHDALLGTVSPSPVKATQGDSQPLTVTENDIAKAVLREVVIPVLEQEVNEGKNFAQLRQVYQSLILATWYKKKIKQSLLSAVYVDRNKTEGVNISDSREAEKIWGQYVEAFKKGAYDFVKEERDLFTDDVIPRKYYSGGMGLSRIMQGLSIQTAGIDSLDLAERPSFIINTNLESMDSSQGNDLSGIPAVRFFNEVLATYNLQPEDLQRLADFLEIPVSELFGSGIRSDDLENPHGSFTTGYKYLNNRFVIKEAAARLHFSGEVRIMNLANILGVAPAGMLMVEGKILTDKDLLEPNFDDDIWNQRACIVMKRAPGMSWRTMFIDGQDFNLNMFRELGRSLGKLHGNGIHHGDLDFNGDTLRMDHIY